MTVIVIAAMLALIIFTGYLIIYNVFQISVTGDIRFYGLLKTIGTTGRQIRRMIRRQAYLLSLVGIPIGLAGGYFVGAGLVPVVISRLTGCTRLCPSARSSLCLQPYSLITVRISCRKLGKWPRAYRRSRRYATRTQARKSRKGNRPAHCGKARGLRRQLPRMAWMNPRPQPRQNGRHRPFARARGGAHATHLHLRHRL